MFSTPEVQRLVSGDNAEIDLDDLKYVTSLMRNRFFFLTCWIVTVILIGMEVFSVNVLKM